MRFDRIIRSPEEPYEGFPLDDQKEKDRFIRILRQVAKKNLVDLETLIMLTMTSISQSNNLSCRDQRSMKNLELQFDRENREDPRFQRILRQDPDSEPRFQRILRQDPDSEPRFQRILRQDPTSRKRFHRILRQDPELEPRFERILRQDPDLEPRFERILRQDPDSEPRFQRILRGGKHLKHFQRWRREREQRATQGAWSPVGKRSEVLMMILQFVEKFFLCLDVVSNVKCGSEIKANIRLCCELKPIALLLFSSLFGNFSI